MSVSVVVPPTEDPVTLAEAKAQCRATHSAEDALIGIYIKAATEFAQNRKNGSICTRTLELRLDEFPGNDQVIKLPRGPVSGVVTVKYIDEAQAEQQLASTEWTLDNRGEIAQLVPAYGKDWPATASCIDAVRVQYQAGTSAANVPASIKLFVLAMVATMFAVRESDAERVVQKHPFLDGLLDEHWEPVF